MQERGEPRTRIQPSTNSLTYEVQFSSRLNLGRLSAITVIRETNTTSGTIRCTVNDEPSLRNNCITFGNLCSTYLIIFGCCIERCFSGKGRHIHFIHLQFFNQRYQKLRPKPSIFMFATRAALDLFERPLIVTRYPPVVKRKRSAAS